MRIVAGRWRNRRLDAPRGDRTRPTADMVREALFSALFDVEGWAVLDLYAGTGAVGLEALSRGATRVVAVERARGALASLRRNVAALDATLDVRAQPVQSALARLAAEGARFDLMFADPPYADAPRALPEVLTAALTLLAEDGVVVAEHRGADEAPPAPPGLEHTRTKRYGEAALSWYARASTAAAPSATPPPMKLAARLSAVAPSATLALTQKAAELKAAGQDVVALTAGEPDFAPPESATEALKKAVDDGHTRYTPVGGRPEVKKTVCAAYAARGLSYTPDQVVISTGAKQSIFNAALALLDPGDEALVIAPYWVSYPDIARIAGAEVVTVDTAEADGFVVRPEALDAGLTARTRLLFLNSPSNPTGGLYSRADLEAVAEVLRRYPDVTIIADEIYAKFVYGDDGFTSLLDVAPDLADRTLVVDGCSKAYAMTGLRLGWALGPKALIGAMTKLQGQSTSNPSAPTQWAAKAVLEGDQSPVARMVEAFAARRARVVEGLRALPGVTCFEPRGAFYAFPSIAGLIGRRLPDGTEIAASQDVCRYLLEDYSVVVVPGEAFGAPTHLRLSYAASDATLDAGLTRMAEAFARID